ncbi:alpha/beta-hydrolase [Mycena rebaudengoi]|nr:alpha/beta-hydrolase [Mycena rebaudengoi]
MMKLISALLSLVFTATQSTASNTGTIVRAPRGGDLNGSNFTYPFPVQLYRFTSQLQPVEMAFMDVAPTGAPNNKTAVLLHGRNFCGATWEATARRLVASGYRVIMPDQVGFCKSTKPAHYQFSLQQLAANTRGLLAALGADARPATVIGHSMGGMTAIRYGLLYPDDVEALALVNPIGLEDWEAKGVPYNSVDNLTVSEAASNYTTIRAYEQSTYYVGDWQPAYDVWAFMLADIYGGSRAATYAFDQGLVIDMVLSQPVVHDFGRLQPRTLLLIGQRDVTAIGKQWSPPEVQAKLGHYDVLGKEAAAAMPNADLIEFPDLGHAPQIQAPDRFHDALLGWLKELSASGSDEES